MVSESTEPLLGRLGAPAQRRHRIMCGYLSLIALLGLAANAVWNATWADPAAALLTIPFVIREGWEALPGDSCGY
jgi:divalent metal cation (Fe/Co/Zn/Cd) transporter